MLCFWQTDKQMNRQTGKQKNKQTKLLYIYFRAICQADLQFKSQGSEKDLCRNNNNKSESDKDWEEIYQEEG